MVARIAVMFALCGAWGCRIPHGTAATAGESSPASVQDQDSPAAPPQSPPAAPEVPAPPSPVTQPVSDLLDALDQSSADLRSFTAQVEYELQDDILGRRELRTGELIYRRNDDGSKSFAVLFDTLIIPPRKQVRLKHYVFDGRWLAEIDHEQKQFIKRELVPPGRRLDPLKLGEGPFPLPIGQPKREVLARFDVAPLQPPAEAAGLLKGLQNVDGLLLTPRPGTPEARDYARVELFYDRQTRLPVGIRAHEAGGNVKTVRLKNVQRNPVLDEAAAHKLDIKPPAADGSWRVDVQPWTGSQDDR